MKQLILTFALSLGLSIAFAHHGGYGTTYSVMDLTCHYNDPYTVIIGNTRFNTPVGGTINIAPGRQHVRIVRNTRGRYAGGSRGIVVYQGIVDIPVGSRVYATIDHREQFYVMRSVPIRVRPAAYGRTGRARSCEPSPRHRPRYVQPTRTTFEDIRHSVSRASFDRNRLAIAKQAIAANGITSSQVLELMDLMSFESTKLALAKFAYYYTVDPENYYLVNNGFSFSSSIQELDRHIYG